MMNVRLITACGCWRDIVVSGAEGDDVLRIPIGVKPDRAYAGEILRAYKGPVRVFKSVGRGKSGVEEYHEVDDA
jgi:hypothetical protein